MPPKIAQKLYQQQNLARLARNAIIEGDLPSFKTHIDNIEMRHVITEMHNTLLVKTIDDKQPEMAKHLLEAGDEYLSEDINHAFLMSAIRKDISSLLLLQTHFDFKRRSQLNCINMSLQLGDIRFAKIIFSLADVYDNDAIYTNFIANSFYEDNFLDFFKLALEMSPAGVEIARHEVREKTALLSRPLDLSYQTLTKVLGRNAAKEAFLKYGDLPTENLAQILRCI